MHYPDELDDTSRMSREAHVRICGGRRLRCLRLPGSPQTGVTPFPTLRSRNKANSLTHNTPWNPGCQLRPEAPRDLFIGFAKSNAAL
jgi:hypothetical protein